MKAILGLTLVGAIWVASFFTGGKSFAPPREPSISRQTRELMTRYANLATQQIKLQYLGEYEDGPQDPKRAHAILEFTQSTVVPIRGPSLDGFFTRKVLVYRSTDGLSHVYAEFDRPAAYIWPRTLDVFLDKTTILHADLDEKNSNDRVGTYHIPNSAQFSMDSPNGHFAWTTSKDMAVLTAAACLFRQDLYKNGEYVKSLAAVSTASPN